MGRLKGWSPARLAPWALIAFCTLWRLPGLADPPWLNDEGVYAMVGRALLHGQKLYRQVWENKPPAIYLLNAAAEQVGGATHVIFSMRLLALVASAIALAALYRLMVAQRGPAPARLAVVLAALGLDLPLIDGTEANAEIFVAAASATAMALIWSVLGGDRKERAPGLILAGIAFGIGTLFKLPAGADGLAGALVILFQGHAAPGQGELGTGGEVGRRLIQLAWLILGAVIPLAAVTAWLAGQGLVGDALYATVGYNRGYVSTGQSLHSPLVGAITILAPLLALAVGTILAWCHRGAALPPGAGAAWWLGLALLGALASGRTYPHYFLQAVVPAAACLTLVLDYLMTRRRAGEHGAAVHMRVVIGLVVIWVLSVPLISVLALRRDGPHPAPGSDTVAYYAYFWQHLTGGLSDTAYGNRIDPRVERNVAVAAYLKAHPRSPHRLYVWGNAPWIYYLSGYDHAARFLSAFYRPTVPGSGAGVLPGLQRRPPPYVVVIAPPNPPAAGLAPWLRTHYVVVFRVENAVVYGLNP